MIMIDEIAVAHLRHQEEDIVMTESVLDVMTTTEETVVIPQPLQEEMIDMEVTEGDLDVPQPHQEGKNGLDLVAPELLQEGTMWAAALQVLVAELLPLHANTVQLQLKAQFPHQNQWKLMEKLVPVGKHCRINS